VRVRLYLDFDRWALNPPRNIEGLPLVGVHSPGCKVDDVLSGCELEFQDSPGTINLCIVKKGVAGGDLPCMHTKGVRYHQHMQITCFQIVYYGTTANAKLWAATEWPIGKNNKEGNRFWKVVCTSGNYVASQTWNQNSLS
jgi:hypothetical protein